MANQRFIISSFGLEALRLSSFEQLPEPARREPVATSLLGTPVYTNIVIRPGSYVNPSGETISYNGMTLNGIVAAVSQSKNIITTAVQGRAGTIKEYIAEGDSQVGLQGVIASPEASRYPQAEIENLVQILQAPTSIAVVSEFLQLFGITDLVIASYSLPQTKGYENIQQFQIDCLSDTPIELLLSRDENP
jgi:uncharacterized protein (UPF0333 family)